MAPQRGYDQSHVTNSEYWQGDEVGNSCAWHVGQNSIFGRKRINDSLNTTNDRDAFSSYYVKTSGPFQKFHYPRVDSSLLTFTRVNMQASRNLTRDRRSLWSVRRALQLHSLFRGAAHFLSFLQSATGLLL